MFGLQPNEIIFTLLLALLIFGPKKLPELARGMGQAIREFRHATTETARDLSEATREPPPAPAKDETRETPPAA